MNIESFTGDAQDLKADLLVLILDPHSQTFDLGESDLNERLEGLRARFAEGALSREVCFAPGEALPGVDTVAVYASDLEKAFPLWENAKTFITRALKLAAETGLTRVVCALNGAGGRELISKVVEGALEGTYAFEKYRQKPKQAFAGLTLALWSAEPAEAELSVGRVFGEAVNAARDLINEPANVVTPAALAAHAESLAEAFGFEFEVWDEARIEAEKMVGLTAVGGGACHPPRMLRLTYPGDGSSEHHLVLLGKGVTFDTGGICIKPADKMYQMKGDMSGAAAVLGAMQAIGHLRPALKVTGLVVSAENTPDALAMRPGDILVYRNGKSVHVDNTDAEGRLILADGLITAGQLGATHIVDIATLTGACARALGPSFTGLMGNNRLLVNAITRAGGNQGESFWKLPLPAEYKEMLKIACADLNNVGGPAAGATTAGLFLQEFVPEKTAWAHLDIAGTFWRDKPWKYYSEGPTGVAVRTLTDLALNWAEHLTR